MENGAGGRFLIQGKHNQIMVRLSLSDPGVIKKIKAHHGYPVFPGSFRTRNAMDTDEGRACCLKLSADLANRIEDHINNQNKIVAVLGGNPESTGCAIHMVPSGKNESMVSNSGIFMKEFHRELCNRKIIVPFRGMRDCRPEWIKQDLEWSEDIFNQS